MRLHIPIAAAAVLALGGPAAAQFQFQRQVTLPAPVQPNPWPVFPPVVQPIDPFAASTVRSLYLTFLGREPDPQGMQFWVGRLAALGGDTAMLTQQFAAEAQIERNSTTTFFTPPVRYRYRFRQRRFW
jgi:hypothetical protein